MLKKITTHDFRYIREILKNEIEKNFFPIYTRAFLIQIGKVCFMHFSPKPMYIFFAILCILLAVCVATSTLYGGITVINISVGFLGGIFLFSLFIGLNAFIRRFDLRVLNTCFLGLLMGCMFTQIALSTLNVVNQFPVTSHDIFRAILFLLCTFAAMTLTIKLEGNYRLIIPFIEFQRKSAKQKDLLVDLSILSDSRFIDFASSGLLDRQLIMPRYAIEDLHNLLNSPDEAQKNKARKGIELLKRLETIPSLDIRYSDIDFPEIKDPLSKLIRLARQLDAYIITSDVNRIQHPAAEGIKIINIHHLSHVLKPVSQTGEVLNIKIQRYGKEPRQGVGYLDDGTMVVVNGGAEFIGESIKAHVLSVKHTTSGRMIFCNASEEMEMIDTSAFVPENDIISKAFIPS